MLIAGGLNNRIGTNVRGQNDQGVFEIDGPAGAVLHDALVEDLKKNLMHVRVRFLDLVE